MKLGGCMESELEMLKLIEKYDRKVKEVIHQMCVDFNVKSKEDFIEKKSKYINGELTINSSRTYIFHGRGCRVYDENQNEIVEWDFGYNNLWYGIDPFFLSRFIELNDSNNTYRNFKETTDTLNKMVSHGKLYKKSNLYYLT